jgi:small-conductance mechanosensitive channel
MFRLVAAVLWGSLSLLAVETVAPATLTLNGETLFTFRALVGSIPPAERVPLISNRLERLLADPVFDLASLRIREEPGLGWEVLQNDQLLLVVTPADAAAEGKPAKTIAKAIAFRLQEIISADRLAKSPRELVIRSLYAALYSLGLLLLLWGTSRLGRFVMAKMQLCEGTLIRSVQINSFELLPAARIMKFGLWFVRTLRIALMLALIYFYVPIVLGLFPWTARYSVLLFSYISNPVREIFTSLVAFMPNLFFIAVDLTLTWYVLKILRAFFSEIEAGRLKFGSFYPDWAKPTFQLIRIFVVAFTLVVIFPYIPGSNSPAFQGVSVFIGILFSFGSSSAMANVISGLVLTYMRSFRIGDRVKIADAIGDIVEKSLLVTRIKTVKNVEITIPNAVVLNSHIINFSTSALAEGLILHTEVTIGYDVPWRKVHELLIHAATQAEGVLKEPAPFVYQTSLDDSYVRYQINAYTRESNRMAAIYSAIHQNIQDAFNQAGVEIMSPAFSAIRDGNTTTIPSEARPLGYEAPHFRISHFEKGKDLS